MMRLMLLTCVAFGMAGCVTEADVRRVERSAARFEEGLNRLEKETLKVEDPRSAWVCGKKTADCQFDLPNGESIEMIGVPCGSFVMGTPEVDPTKDVNSCIGHKVTLTEPFWLAKFPLTIAQRRALLADSECEMISGFREHSKGYAPDKFDPEWPSHTLTWKEAQLIAEKMNQLFGSTLPSGYRFSLPTEAQWEYACRAGTVTAFNNGSDLTTVKQEVSLPGGKKIEVDLCPQIDDISWNISNSSFDWHPVGQKKPNAWGFYDMHGLTPEWCQDLYDDALEHKSINMVNPKGPKTNESGAHVKRGGHFCDLPICLTVYHRSSAGFFPEHERLDKWLWNKPAYAGVRLAIVKDAPESVDEYDKRLYGKNHEIEYQWKMNQLNQLKTTFDHETADVQEKFKYAPLLKLTAEVAIPAAEVFVGTMIAGSAGAAPEEMATSDGVSSGYGTIKGPSSLTNGKTATYSLYVGGKKIGSGVDWAQDGTSISVYGAGDHARAMAGNPPIRSGSFRSGIRATYNGKTYRKTIRIFK